MSAPVFVQRATSRGHELEHRLVVAEVNSHGEPTRISAQLVCRCGCLVDEYALDADPRAQDPDAILAAAMASYETSVICVICPACRWTARFTPGGVLWRSPQ